MSTLNKLINKKKNNNKTPFTSSSTDNYVCGVGILAVLAIGVCVFLAYNTSQAANKNQINEKQQPKRRHML